jgi:hypothetical protein
MSWDKLTIEDLTGEQWKPVLGFEDSYMVSNLGRIKSMYRQSRKPGLKNNPSVMLRPKIMKQNIQPTGYRIVQLSKSGRVKGLPVHRIIAMAFIPNPDNKPFINHIDANPSNNDLSNLEWCTQSENIQHAYNIGTKVPPSGGPKKFGKDNHVSRPVLQYSLSGEFIREWECVSQIQTTHNFNRPNICKCCKGKINSAYGFVWKYKTV